MILIFLLVRKLRFIIGEVVGRNGVMYKVKTNLGIEIMPRYKIQTLIKYAL